MSAGSGTEHHVEVRRGAYADSVELLRVSRDVAALPGVAAAQVAMATPLNIEVLERMGFDVPPEATPNDLVVAIRLSDDAASEPASAQALAHALAGVDRALAPRRAGAAETGAEDPPHTTAAALRALPGDESGLVLVSTPGASAVVEAVDAIDAGRDVMIFSDGVPLEHEVALKRRAAAAGTLVMGPDCGTAVVGGVGLGFADVVTPGPVGLVAASGTGCQHLLALLDRAGVGVSSAYGVGGRDLSAAVGGLATMTALDRLAADDGTDLVVVVSKPAAPEVADRVRAHAEGLATPVDFAVLGPDSPDLTRAAERVLRRLGRAVPPWPVAGEARPRQEGGPIRGLFVGGTLRDEAAAVVAAADPAGGAAGAGDTEDTGHTFVDFGDDDLTEGRAHPMIDPTLRNEALGEALDDPATGVVLLDVVLGHGAETDPAAGLVAVLGRCPPEQRPPVVACVVGTAGDPQGLERQIGLLADAGVEVHVSNAGAARRAVDLARGER